MSANGHEIETRAAILVDCDTKLNLLGAPMAGASFTVGEVLPGGPLYVCEGIGQA